MFQGSKVAVVLPAYNAAKTLAKTYNEIPHDIVDEVILVDDCSKDDTVEVARKIGIRHVVCHDVNAGYGANQKSCYKKALSLGAEIVVMLHPDYQYTPKLITTMVSMIGFGVFPVVFGSRILGKGALRGKMPLYKYFSNRVLTGFQNILMNQKLSEYHTGYRAYSRRVLEGIDFERNSNDFIFDNELAAQIFFKGYDIGEVTCPTRYTSESSSINFSRSVKYGMGVLRVSLLYFMTKAGLYKWSLLQH